MGPETWVGRTNKQDPLYRRGVPLQEHGWMAPDLPQSGADGNVTICPNTVQDFGRGARVRRETGNAAVRNPDTQELAWGLARSHSGREDSKLFPGLADITQLQVHWLIYRQHLKWNDKEAQETKPFSRFSVRPNTILSPQLPVIESGLWLKGTWGTSPMGKSNFIEPGGTTPLQRTKFLPEGSLLGTKGRPPTRKRKEALSLKVS